MDCVVAPHRKEGCLDIVDADDWDVNLLHVHPCGSESRSSVVILAAGHDAVIITSGDRGKTWSSLDAVPAHHAESGRGPTQAIWFLAESGTTLFAGIDPAGDEGGANDPGD